jgi:hypothetical protein
MKFLGTGETTHFTGPGKYRAIAGVVTVTSERLLFTRFRGLFSKKPQLILNLPLESIETVEVPSGRPVLVLSALAGDASRRLTLELDRDNPAELKSVLESLRAARRAALDRAAQASRPTVKADVHVTVHTPPAPSPPPRVMVRCPYCRTVYPELEAKCPNCGAHF